MKTKAPQQATRRSPRMVPLPDVEAEIDRRFDEACRGADEAWKRGDVIGHRLYARQLGTLVELRIWLNATWPAAARAGNAKMRSGHE